jgi:amidase
MTRAGAWWRRRGEGEIVGSGLEISMEVEFSVALHQQAAIRWPRGETADCLFAVGNARPLDQAVQHATTELLRWLRDDLHLDELGAHILLGQCAEYDVGNVYDPAYTMVCKIAKKLLPAPASSTRLSRPSGTTSGSCDRAPTAVPPG